MAFLNLTPKQKLIAVIFISSLFFIAEIAVAFYTRSLALLADAFHYLNDLIGFAVALAAIYVSERATSPKNFSFGWARAQLLGSFFNGVFLLALGVSIFLQSIERFISIKPVDDPKLVLIIGSIGLALNILSATILHGHHDHGHGHGHGHGHAHGHGHSHGHSHSDSHSHSHSDEDRCETGQQHEHGHDPESGEVVIPLGRSSSDNVSTPASDHTDHRHNVVKLEPQGHDLGMMGVLIHVLGDALNNLATMIAALVIWQSDSPYRFYADPAVSTVIAIMIFLSSIPLVKRSGEILMQSAPRGLDIDDVKHDLEMIAGVTEVENLHIWNLDGTNCVASVHVLVGENYPVKDLSNLYKIAKDCFKAYGVDTITLQPRLATATSIPADPNNADSYVESKSTSNDSTGSTLPKTPKFAQIPEHQD